MPSTPTSSISTISSATTQKSKRRNDLFYFHSIVFEAEGALFRVPRYGLPGNAAAFETKFSFSPASDSENVPGSSDENPIRLEEDVSEFDFASLLKATYPPRPGQVASTLSVDEWMSVLKLCRKWGFVDLRERAVQEADTHVRDKTPLEKIVLGKKYGVTKWLEEGYCAIATRWDPLTPEERTTLDLETWLKIMRLRDRVWKDLVQQVWGTNHDFKRLNTLGGVPGQIKAAREIFGEELKANES
ncbi:hypothetical protein PENSPDRAFT_573292 [Peniophora sp. CONT]|nr:hypothetical protein PENSPDRAFT_573292 [Peniophora sp. CONT]